MVLGRAGKQDTWVEVQNLEAQEDEWEGWGPGSEEKCRKKLARKLRAKVRGKFHAASEAGWPERGWIALDVGKNAEVNRFVRYHLARDQEFWPKLIAPIAKDFPMFAGLVTYFYSANDVSASQVVWWPVKLE